MKAVIMAGGEGTRLRPLTCDIPKPMARLCGRTTLEYILDLLHRNGVTDAAVTLKYLPGVIRDAYPSGEAQGVRLHFFEEDEPRGTAGSVKNASPVLDEDFLVISGDALCDFDLSAAFRFHREKKAAVTLLLSHVSDPREYGLVVTGPDGAVKGFVEKPAWTQAVTDAVNTGIYIVSPACLGLIPDNGAFDFAKDLFPLMMQKQMPIFGFEADGYWCDIGDIDAYVSCQFDMLEGKVECRIPGAKQNGVFYKGQRPTGVYRVLAPSYIGEGVKIGEGAVIGPCAVLDDGCTVGGGATVKSSVLLPDAYAGDRTELRGALVCAGASLKKSAAMFEGAVAGSGAVVGEGAAVSPGVRIWPGKTVEDGARAAVNLKYGAARRGLFDEEGISGEIGVELSPEICAKIGAAAGSVFENARIGVADDGSGVGTAFKNAVCSGIQSTGTRVFDFGSCFEAQFRYATAFSGAQIGIFARTAGSRAVLTLTGREGLPVGRAVERKIDTAVAAGEIRRCRPADYRAPFNLQGLRPIYQQEILRYAPDGLAGMHATVKSANHEIVKTLAEVLEAARCGQGGIKIHLDGSGRQVSFFDENGQYVDYARSLALGCLIAFEEGQDVAVPFEAPRAIDTLANEHGHRVLRYLACPADAGDREARALAAKQLWVRDGLCCAVRILAYLQRKCLTLSETSKRLPGFAVAVKAVPCRGNPGNLMRMLGAQGKPARAAGISEGMLLTANGGKVLLSPLKRGGGLRILAEAADMEAAGEICDFFEKKLQEDDMREAALDSGKQKG